MGIRKYPCFMVFVFFICCFFFTSILSHGADSISANQSLSGNQTITSAGGNFELGFYKPGNSSYYYISMWYAKVSTLTIDWVANRDNPISDKYSSVLKILYGQVQQLTWLESTKQWNVFWVQRDKECEVHDFCGQYGICNNIIQPFCNCLTGFNPKSLNDWNLSDYSGGCVRRTEFFVWEYYCR
ncbi:G-type lectin S-receptor-like serine/threonine-protein kinase [Camellia lanceoleosa]|nr:G-type lectin S-receptor-like serine/threonine-protein kinase [Camellia lanceoleosa]